MARHSCTGGATARCACPKGRRAYAYATSLAHDECSKKVPQMATILQGRHNLLAIQNPTLQYL